jgi:hypothetical protein
MSQAKTKTVFESAMSKARIARQGDITMVIIDGGGAMVVPTMEYNQAYRWAMSKPATGNPLTDRGRFFDKITTVVSRPGSFIGTRGHDKAIATLAKAMKAAGFDLNDWSLAPEIKDERVAAAKAALEEKRKEVRDARRAAEAAGEGESEIEPRE